jgi:hypothetical protein
MEGFSFVMPITGLNRPNTGKEDDDDDECSKVEMYEQHGDLISLLFLT